MVNTAFHIMALGSTCVGAACIYLAAPRQQWLSRPLPVAPGRLGGGIMLLLGCLLWSRILHPATAIFATLTVAMVLFILFPPLAALSAALRKR